MWRACLSTHANDLATGTDQQAPPKPVPSEGRFQASPVQVITQPKGEEKDCEARPPHPPLLRRNGGAIFSISSALNALDPEYHEIDHWDVSSWLTRPFVVVAVVAVVAVLAVVVWCGRDTYNDVFIHNAAGLHQIVGPAVKQLTPALHLCAKLQKNKHQLRDVARPRIQHETTESKAQPVPTSPYPHTNSRTRASSKPP